MQKQEKSRIVREIVVIGVGGHASMIADTAREAGFRLIGLASWRHRGVAAADIEYIGDFDHYLSVCDDDDSKRTIDAICGVGDNEKRQDIVCQIEEAWPGRVCWCSVVHPSAIVSASARIGKGTIIAARAVVQTNAHIGCHCIINSAATIDHDSRVENYAHCAPGVVCCGNVHIQKGVLVGAGARVVPNCTVRSWSLVKAGSTVVRSSSIVPIYVPLISKAHKDAVIEAIESGWVSWQGPAVKRAEKRLRDIVGTKHVLLTCNGTMACHCLFLALRYRYPKVNTIYVPNNVYVAAWNAAIYEYADDSIRVLRIDEQTWNASTDAIADQVPSDGTAAVLVVHNIGNIVNVPALRRRRPDLVFVEDACEGLFGTYEGEPVGSASFASAFSFFANKTVTCGEGGAFCTNDDEVADYIMRCCCQGVTEKKYVHSILGYNYRITNLQAALLDAQLKDYEVPLKLKESITAKYKEGLKNVSNIQFCRHDAQTTPSNWMTAVRVLGAPNYEEAYKFFMDRFVETRPFFYPISEHKHLKSIAFSPINTDPIGAAISDQLCREIILLPSYPMLKTRTVDYIVRVVREWAQRCV